LKNATIIYKLKIRELESAHKGKIEFYLAVLKETKKLPKENGAIDTMIG